MIKTTVSCLCLLVLLVFSFGTSRATSGDMPGEAVFRTLHCNGCHKPEGKGVGISLSKIAKGYAGQASRLNDYLAGEAEAMLNPAKARIMARHLKKTKKLSPAQRKALTDYLLSFQ